MAVATAELAEALRKTAAHLQCEGVRYQWSHHGACNCGHLVQTLTDLPPAEIHRMALEKAGDWAEKAIEYCPTSRYPIDHVIGTLLAIGLDTDDIVHLERLDDRAVLRRIPAAGRPLRRNRREDVVRYMRAWADLLDAERAAAGAEVRPLLRDLTPEEAPRPRAASEGG